MKREERLRYLIGVLLAEQPAYAFRPVPDHVEAQEKLLQALMNVRNPKPIGQDFLDRQDEELTFQKIRKGVVKANELEEYAPGSRLCLWQGDITRLEVDGIVNAANSRMLGCFVPLHSCIDNVIHSAAGVQMRWECHTLMQRLGRDARTGEVLLTRGYNLPARYVLHVTGPIVTGDDGPTDEQKEELRACYANCLAKAECEGMESIAFCCISTGVFRFPNAEAAEIAMGEVREYFREHPQSCIRKVIFNVFKDEDLHIYQKLLSDG